MKQRKWILCLILITVITGCTDSKDNYENTVTVERNDKDMTKKDIKETYKDFNQYIDNYECTDEVEIRNLVDDLYGGEDLESYSLTVEISRPREDKTWEIKYIIDTYKDGSRKISTVTSYNPEYRNNQDIIRAEAIHYHADDAKYVKSDVILTKEDIDRYDEYLPEENRYEALKGNSIINYEYLNIKRDSSRQWEKCTKDDLDELEKNLVIRNLPIDLNEEHHEIFKSKSGELYYLYGYLEPEAFNKLAPNKAFNNRAEDKVKYVYAFIKDNNSIRLYYAEFFLNDEYILKYMLNTVEKEKFDIEKCEGLHN